MILIWLLIVISIAAWTFAIWAATHPNIVGRGQDAAGKGMAAGCLGIMFGSLGTLCAVIAGINTWIWFSQLDAVTRIAGFVPAAVIAAGFLASWAIAKNARARRRRDYRKLERQQDAMVILCHEEPELSQIFAAFQAVQPARWQQLFKNPEHLRWLVGEYVYRAALISLHITPEIAKDPELEILLQLLEREEPSANVLLYGPDESVLAPAAARLGKAKWAVQTLIVSGGGWIQSQWLPRALELAGPPPKG